jgi:stage II sporulation protein D
MTGRIVITQLLIFFFMKSGCADIRIALFHGDKVQSVVFSTVQGEYLLTADGRQIAAVRKGTMFHIEQTEKGLSVHDTLQAYGYFNQLEFKGISDSNVFQLKPVYPSMNARESDDNLTLDLAGGSLRMVNRMDMEKYIAGCVEAEGGPNASEEFYKAQAVIVRTFAYRNFARHAPQGFNLCDGVHCQAYHGKSRMNKTIYSATSATRGMILADSRGEAINTSYHANCGGITSSASMAWNKDLPHLVSVKDPFCSKSSQHSWKKSLSLGEWKNYLKQKGIIWKPGELMDTVTGMRRKYLVYGDARLPMTEIRQDLNLRSAFFTLEENSDTVIITGYGYGHGVGMCQDGAMEMSRAGFCFVDILMFYFHQVQLSTKE